MTLLWPHGLPGSSAHGISQARILEWVAISFFRGSSWPRNQTHVSCIAGGFFTAEPPGKPLIYIFMSHSSVQSVQFSHSLCLTLCNRNELQHTRLPCLSPTLRACSKSCPSSLWCHPTISSSVIPFFSRLQPFSASGSFPVSQFFISGGQSIGVSASASVFSMNIQDWFPLGLTGWISLQPKWLSRVFPNTTVQKYQFFSAQLSL